MPELKSRQLVYGPKNLGVSATEFSDAVAIPQGTRQCVFWGKADNTAQLAAGTDIEISVDGGTTWSAITSFFTKADVSLALADLSVNWGGMAVTGRGASGTSIPLLPATHLRVKLVNGAAQVNNLRLYAIVE